MSEARQIALRAYHGGQDIQTQIAPGVMTNGDRELLTQALANLVIRHTMPVPG